MPAEQTNSFYPVATALQKAQRWDFRSCASRGSTGDKAAPRIIGAVFSFKSHTPGDTCAKG